MSDRETWREPVRGGYPDPAMLGLPGRKRLETWLREGSQFPPLTHLTGARPAAVADGTAPVALATGTAMYLRDRPATLDREIELSGS